MCNIPLRLDAVESHHPTSSTQISSRSIIYCKTCGIPPHEEYPDLYLALSTFITISTTKTPKSNTDEAHPSKYQRTWRNATHLTHTREFPPGSLPLDRL